MAKSNEGRIGFNVQEQCLDPWGILHHKSSLWDANGLTKPREMLLGELRVIKAKLVAKGFTQREWIDYNDTFSPVSSKDSMRVIMALTAHFDLELHQMNVKTAFLNGDLLEDIYIYIYIYMYGSAYYIC